MANDVKFLSQGRFIDKEEARKRPIMVAGSILPDDRLAQTFDSEEDFRKWIDHSKVAEKFYEIDKTVAQLRERQHSGDHTPSQRRLKYVVDRVTNELNELAARHHLDPQESGYELFLKATVERDLLEPPIFDPFVLYEHVGLKGRWLPIGAFFPIVDFRWLNWNDIASSVAVFGSGCLFQDIWFGGPRLYFGGYPWAFNLTDYGWNDRASSAIGA
jgi:hypothetical protein